MTKASRTHPTTHSATTLATRLLQSSDTSAVSKQNNCTVPPCVSFLGAYSYPQLSIICSFLLRLFIAQNMTSALSPNL
ncbi:hypothetical protein E2C01_095847 [Portunus trituberculatus]|uniref:Uncharacterized protein n=1 Tax=Portunus trituberculatus TaxID=210409 RepID=A0A5B7K043_PORTR|nr:hypothetical protein [Portunus trituberculatus]